jgi:lactoylglutathione lyase
VAAGAAVVAAPREMPWGQTVAYVRSPEGTVLGLCTPPTK